MRLTFSFDLDVAGDNEAAVVQGYLRELFPDARVHDAEETPTRWTDDEPGPVRFTI